MVKRFRTSRYMLVSMTVDGECDEDGNVTITDVISVDAPSAGDVMDGLTQEECEKFDTDFANAD